MESAVAVYLDVSHYSKIFCRRKCLLDQKRFLRRGQEIKFVKSAIGDLSRYTQHFLQSLDPGLHETRIS